MSSQPYRPLSPLHRKLALTSPPSQRNTPLLSPHPTCQPLRRHGVMGTQLKQADKSCLPRPQWSRPARVQHPPQTGLALSLSLSTWAVTNRTGSLPGPPQAGLALSLSRHRQDWLSPCAATDRTGSLPLPGPSLTGLALSLSPGRHRQDWLSASPSPRAATDRTDSLPLPLPGPSQTGLALSLSLGRHRQD